MQAILFAVNHV